MSYTPEMTYGHALSEPDPLLLWYREPARAWTEALPIGNGRLGAMVFGGLEIERIQLNEDTLWSGFPESSVPRPDRAILPAIRRLIMHEHRYIEAEALTRQFQGPFNESFLPLADLTILVGHRDEAANYRRELDLNHALVRVRYQVGDATYTREIFSSAVHQVIVARLTCDAAAAVTCLVGLASPLRAATIAIGNTTLALAGKAPSHVVSHHLETDEPIVYDDAEGRGMRFEARVMAQIEGGTLTAGPSGLQITAATAVTLLVAGATGYHGPGHLPDRTAAEIGRAIRATLDAATSQPYRELRSAHVADYQHLFNRVSLSLGSAPAADEPTDERIRSEGHTADPRLAALYAQYGRYLLISSSRPGTQPANLQGLWNDQPRPTWGSDFTVNINLQMNYWPAEVANLPECHEPLCDLIADLSVDGKETAWLTYGCRGWAMHNGSDIWRTTRVGGDGYSPARWTMWPMGGAWLSRHLWEHYAFGGNLKFLRDVAYPVIRGAAEFCLDWLIVDQDGYLVTCPSTSPENAFVCPDGSEAAVTVAASMDIQLTRDLFDNCIEASTFLGVDEHFRADLRQALARLLPPRIGRHGQLQEWAIDHVESELGHRHISHLYAVHPGNQIAPSESPELAAAAKRSLERRTAHGGGRVGWSTAWMVNQWARLGDGDRAHACLLSLLRTSTLPNMFNDGPPFQIDGNFGGAAGIFEMLVQSHTGTIDLLPALPATWPDGSVRGLRARGGFSVAMHWSRGSLDQAVIVADRSGVCQVRYGALPLRVEGATAATAASHGDTLVFNAIAGQATVIRVSR